MSRTTDSPHLPATSNTDVTVSVDGHVCPFCGLTREITDEFDPSTPCPRCTLADTPATRAATKTRVGPWHVRQVRNPWAPGMGFETLLALVKRGQVTKDSIVRGPTTHQLWKRACEIKGLSREFGVCFSCQAELERTATLCAHCNRLQEPPINPDVLVEGREPVIAPAPSGATTRHARPQSPKTEARFESHAESEAPRLEIGSTTPDMSPDDMLAADEAALARKITTRPPVAAPMPQPASVRPPRSLRPRTAGVDDALLTPQELAQAFQLGFAPRGGEVKQGKSKFAIVVVLLLIVGGLAALASLQPEIRRSATRWISDTWASLTSRKAPPLPPALPETDLSSLDLPDATTRPQREPQVILPAAPAPELKSVEVADAPLAPATKAVAPAASAPALPPIVEIASPAPTTVATGIPAAEAAGLARGDASASSTSPAVVSIEAPATSEPVVDPEERARTLWRKAIDAEVNQDYVEAVACYEKIKKLPADVQPWGLDVRLEQAKKLAK